VQNPAPYVVLMAGGSGTRLWPVSTAERPKQLIPLIGDRSLLQLTLARTEGLVSPDRVLVLTSARYADEVRRQTPEVPARNVIAEPVPRDTSGAVGLAAALGRGRFGAESPMIVLPADHIIEPVTGFQAAIRSALDGVREGEALYTFGIRPTHAATGYGYLERGTPVPGRADHFRLARFREKPDPATAQQFLDSGRFAWNSGMFVWRTSTIWHALETHLPAHAEALGPLSAAVDAPDLPARLAAAFEPLPRISIDFGVMEKWRDVRMVETSFTWCDVGGWPALADFLMKDEHGNALRAQLEALEAHDNVVFCTDPEELVALVGVADLVVVRAGKQTLVADRRRAEEVKAIVQRLAGRTAQGGSP
jgi:mannose-1-phosphate guanylyltransferase